MWDPSFETWRGFGVRSNSSMAILSPDLSGSSNVFFGFNAQDQADILAALPDFS